MIIHLIHYPVSAKRFVEPLVSALIEAGYDVQLWFENRSELTGFSDSITVPKRYIDFDLTPNPFKCLARLISLFRIFRREKPQAIHTHQSRSSFLPLLAAFAARVKIRIYHNHGLPYLGYKGPKRFLFWMLEFLNSAMATHTLAISLPLLDEMVKSKIASVKKATCLGRGSICGIDLNEFTIEKFDPQNRDIARKKLNISPDAFVVLYVGRPFKRKGYHDLLNAWQIFISENPDANPVLITAGCDLHDAVSINNQPPPGLMPIGYVTDLISYYAACDIVALPSWHEGLPYSLLEAAAAGRAIITTDIPGADTLVENGTTGLLVPVENPKQLSVAVKRLCDDKPLCVKLAENARAVAEKFFDRNISKTLLIEYYNKIGLQPDKVVILRK
ncbi:MAG: glycosyltransferase family 4 protein [Anaerohalosphaeraceae bacterium]|nr:glycosyltransferase family 4 protein [Anaerohalosphaeraceae bacterium]